MSEWFHTFADALWLRPDDIGDAEALFIRKALRLRKGRRVLDAPCGAGRVTVHLAKMGLDVTGIDLRPQFVRRARARCRKEGVAGTFKAMDLRMLDVENEFHGIVNWQGSFGYFSDEENAGLVRRYARALRKGGRLLIDQVNREFILRHFRHQSEADGVVMRSRWDPATERIHGTWINSRGGRRKNELHIRLHTPGQMQQILENAGLRVTRMYGSFMGDKYRRGSNRMITVGKRR